MAAAAHITLGLDPIHSGHDCDPAASAVSYRIGSTLGRDVQAQPAAFSAERSDNGDRANLSHRYVFGLSGMVDVGCHCAHLDSFIRYAAKPAGMGDGRAIQICRRFQA